MKKVLLPVLMIMTFVSARSQDILNASFEDWYNYDFCLCDLLEGHTLDRDSSHKWQYPFDYSQERAVASKSKRGDAQDGNYSVHIQNYTYGLSPLRYQMPYKDLTEDVLSGYFKSNIQDGDSAHIRVFYQKGTTELSSASFYISSSVNDWKFFQLDLNKDNKADSIIFEFWPSTSDTTSEIWVDNIAFAAKVDANNPDLSNAISIYPNPSLGNLNIASTSAVEGKVSVSFKDLSGRELKHFSYNALQGTTNQQLDISSLPKGIYLLTLETKQGVLSRKIILE